MLKLFNNRKNVKVEGSNVTKWMTKNNVTIEQIYQILSTLQIFYFDINAIKSDINENVLKMYFTTPSKLDLKITLKENKNILVEYESLGANVKLEFDRFGKEVLREEESIDYKVKIKEDNTGIIYSFEKTLKLEGVKANAERINVSLEIKENPNDIMLLNEYLKSITKVDYGKIYSTIISLLGYTSWVIKEKVVRLDIETRRLYDDDRVIIPYAIEIKEGCVIRYIYSIADKGYLRYENSKYFYSPDAEFLLETKLHFGIVLDVFYRKGFIKSSLYWIIKSDWKSNHLKFE